MTIPWQMNCPHDDEGWCLPFVSEFGNEYMNLQMRNMDLNAENAKLREQLAELASANGELKMQIVELKRMARAVNEWMVNNAD